MTASEPTITFAIDHAVESDHIVVRATLMEGGKTFRAEKKITPHEYGCYDSKYIIEATKKSLVAQIEHEKRVRAYQNSVATIASGGGTTASQPLPAKAPRPTILGDTLLLLCGD